MIPTLDPEAMLHNYVGIPPDDSDPAEEATRVAILHLVPKQFGQPHVVASLVGGPPPIMAALMLGSMADDEISMFREFILLTETWIAEVRTEDADDHPTPKVMAREGDPRSVSGAIGLQVWNGGHRFSALIESTADDGSVTWEALGSRFIPRSPAMERLVALSERLAP